MKVTGIATQGRQDADQWVTAYRLYYSSDGVYFSSVKYWWNSYVKVRKKVLCTGDIIYIYIRNILYMTISYHNISGKNT